MRYRPDAPLILKNIKLKIKPGEKIGVCGRTGSDKSTLLLCLFLISEGYEGKILIDDIYYHIHRFRYFHKNYQFESFFLLLNISFCLFVLLHRVFLPDIFCDPFLK